MTSTSPANPASPISPVNLASLQLSAEGPAAVGVALKIFVDMFVYFVSVFEIRLRFVEVELRYV